MRINDLLLESITFNPIVEKDYDGRKVWSSVDWETLTKEPCYVCHGTGKETYDNESYSCRRCDSTGTIEEYVSSAPELNVSNSNGIEIQRMLGIPNPDYGGIIHHQDIPKFIQRLIKLKNQDSSQYTQATSDTRGPMGRTHTDDQGVTHSGHRGPRMIDVGRSQSQIDTYIDRLLEILEFAQENNASVGWG